MFWNRSKDSVQELLGIIGFTKYGLLTESGERIYFRIAPTNISVMSEARLTERIGKMADLLKTYPEIELCCVDAAEDYDSNKAEYRRLHDKEENPIVQKLLEEESRLLDSKQTEMATSRQFMISVQLKPSRERQVFEIVNDVEKALANSLFEAKLMTTGDLKRMIGLYLGTSRNGEQTPDYDGEQYITEAFYDDEE